MVEGARGIEDVSPDAWDVTEALEADGATVDPLEAEIMTEALLPLEEVVAEAVGRVVRLALVVALSVSLELDTPVV